MDTPDRPTVEDRDETDAQRADRNFAEVVQELRVSQTGVQILFAFLLSLSFMNAFPGTDPTFRWVLAAALLTAAAATICFIAPVATHRMQFRRGRKESIVWVAHRMAAAGLVFLIASMSLAVWLVIAHLWDSSTGATVVAIAMVAVAGLLWVAMPIVWIGKPTEGSDFER